MGKYRRYLSNAYVRSPHAKFMHLSDVYDIICVASMCIQYSKNGRRLAQFIRENVGHSCD